MWYWQTDQTCPPHNDLHYLKWYYSLPFDTMSIKIHGNILVNVLQMIQQKKRQNIIFIYFIGDCIYQTKAKIYPKQIFIWPKSSI